jgi:hypothetical protein
MRAVIALAGFVNGDDVGMVNASRGSRFILKTQQEVGVIQQLTAQSFERHRTVVHRDLLGDKDRTHAARAQFPDKPETAGKTRNELGVDLSHSGKTLARRRSGEFTSPHGGVKPPLRQAVSMLDGEQTFKVTGTVHDSQYDNLIWVGLIKDKMLTKTCD